VIPKARETFLISETSRPDLGPTKLSVQWYHGIFSKVKRLGREVDHLPQSGAEVKNEWSCTPASIICLRGVESDEFTFTHIPWPDFMEFRIPFAFYS
jgi:hypothetical protein